MSHVLNTNRSAHAHTHFSQMRQTLWKCFRLKQYQAFFFFQTIAKGQKVTVKRHNFFFLKSVIMQIRQKFLFAHLPGSTSPSHPNFAPSPQTYISRVCFSHSDKRQASAPACFVLIRTGLMPRVSRAPCVPACRMTHVSVVFTSSYPAGITNSPLRAVSHLI